MKLSRLQTLLGAALLTTGLHAAAAPVTFNITAASLTPGSGYGVDVDEALGTLLDVRFSTTGFSVQNFTLSTVGQSHEFRIGTADFREPLASGGILGAETDNLGVTAILNFVSPTGPQTLFTLGEATIGAIDDNQRDYRLHWFDLTNIAFGTGGLFDISFNTLNFSHNNEGAKNLNATVTLRALPTIQAQQSVPEPGSLALVALALLGLRQLSRRRG